MMPVVGYRALTNKKALPKLRERLGNLPKGLKADGRPTIWIHACSVGEVVSAQPLAEALAERFPYARFVVSVVTRTGRKIAEERFAKYGPDAVFYFPVDLPACVKNVLNHIKPQMLICIDTEIWPNLIHECRARNIPVFLANGRISAKSFRHYRYLQPLLAPVLANYTMLLMKSESDAQRIRRMGAPASRVRVTGNIKYDRGAAEHEIAKSQKCAIDRSFGLSGASGPLIVAGSTHDREEAALFDVLARVRREHGLEQTRLLIAPRHPERFDAVESLARKMGHSVVRRTSEASDTDAEVLLLDTIGELATAYSFATVAFVGGTLIPFGGQSITEPALYGKPIVIGPSMDNFAEVIGDFRERDAIVQISSGIDQPDEQRSRLAQEFISLLNDEDRRARLGEHARSILEECRGATGRTAEYIADVFAAIAR